MKVIRWTVLGLMIATAGTSGIALASLSSKAGTPATSAATGLATAIAHVTASNAKHPTKGLANALSHLQANQTMQTAGPGGHGH